MQQCDHWELHLHKFILDFMAEEYSLHKDARVIQSGMGVKGRAISTFLTLYLT